MYYAKQLTAIFIVALLTACTSTPDAPLPKTPEPVVQKKSPLEQQLDEAENKATPQGRKVLQTGRQMALVNGEIIQGGCWDYANTVYNRAGYKKQRQTVFEGTKQEGPYADASLIQHGDFLYYVNHSYGDIEHSAIFVDWLDYPTKTALMLSYAGERRQQPARYKPYELTHVYQIIRAK
jgi:hypothetical protein